MREEVDAIGILLCSCIMWFIECDLNGGCEWIGLGEWMSGELTVQQTVIKFTQS